jgi:tRNA threonylcarbamoyladenosine biosynthesis protein TsaE
VTYQRICESAAATQSAGEEFARLLRPGDIVLLSGRLGAGKTTFVKGVARALGVVERITSPTFTMVRQHEAHNELGVATLHHADVFRVESLGEVLDLDLGELVEEDAVAMVEWGDLAASVFGRDVVTVTFSPDDVDEEVRRIDVGGSIDAARAADLVIWSSS